VEEPRTETPEKPSRIGILLGFVFLTGLIALAVLVLYRIYPASVGHKKSPNWIDLLFESPLVIFAGRLLLLSIALVLAFASAFTILSVVSWTKHRQWLTKAGPFEVSRDAVEALKAQLEFWQQQAVDENTEAQALRDRLQETEQLLNSIVELMPGEVDLEENGDHDLSDDDAHS
jgi:hypothetical protein